MPADINVISPQNSVTGINLAPNAFFNGAYIDVTDFTTITVSYAGNLPPASTDGLQIEWSHDGVTLFSQSIFGGSTTFDTVHATIRARYARVRYHASGAGQSNLTVQTLLRKGTISGGVSRVGQVTGSPDAQITNSVIFARPLGAPNTHVSLFASDDPFLITTPPPPRSTFANQTITATTAFSPQFDFFGIFGATRRFMTVFNNTNRGNLYLNLGGAATLAAFHYKIPPQAFWTMPESRIVYSGTVFGIWDFADGDARVAEAF